jgi:poly(hydroxyalkanoate) granule-associated protein
MAKKLKSSISEQQLADKITESASQIWLAGLAAFEKAQTEGGKIFDKLVREGEKVESRTRKITGESLEEVKSKATGTWDKLEQVFEDRVERALSGLGVPSNHQLSDLAAKVDALSEAVKDLTAQKASKHRGRATASTAGTKNQEATGPDDLKVISGVGPVLERKLNDIGINSYRQIAAWKAEDIKQVESAIMRVPGRITRDNWVAQAKVAQQEKYHGKS